MSEEKRMPETFGWCDFVNNCCGMMEYTGLNNRNFSAEGAIASMYSCGEYKWRNLDGAGGCCHVLLTQKYHPSVGRKEGGKPLDSFVRYVARHNLGGVTLARAKKNPNSGNMIIAALFAPNVAAMIAWGAERGSPPEKRKPINRWGVW